MHLSDRKVPQISPPNNYKKKKRITGSCVINVRIFVILKASFFIIMYGYHSICFTIMLNMFIETVAVTEMHTFNHEPFGCGRGGGGGQFAVLYGSVFINLLCNPAID